MAYTPSTTFVFPGGDYAPQKLFEFSPIPAGGITGTLPLFSGFIQGKNDAVEGNIDGTLPIFSGSLTGSFAANVARVTAHRGCALANEAASAVHQALMVRRQAARSPTKIHVDRDAATALHQAAALSIEQTRLTLTRQTADVATGVSVSQAWAATVEQLPQLHLKRCGTVDTGQWLTHHALAEFDLVEFIHTETRHPIDDAGQTRHAFIRIAHADPLEPYTPGTMFILGEAYTPSKLFIWPHAAPEVPLLDNQQLAGIRHQASGRFQYATPAYKRQCVIVQHTMRPLPGRSVISIDPPREPPPVDPEHIIHTIPERAAYMIEHSLSVTLLDLTPVPMLSVGLSLDADAYAWQFRGTLADPDAIALVQQPPNGDAVQLIITINGAEWRVIVERIEHGRQFGKRTISLTGRGLSAYLGQPYQQPASATQASELTIQQLAELQLPLGWTLEWECSTWLVPNGAFTFTGQTPIQVLAGIANDIGAWLKPSRTSQVLTMAPRYPVLPWQFPLAAADLIVPESAITELVQRPIVPSVINGVYVHGGEIGGVTGWCRLNGTDGAVLAPTVSNSLITDVVAARALGERVLAAHAEQPAIQSLTLPMDGDEFPLAEIGWLAQVTVDSVAVRGIVNAVSIDAALGSVRQTLTLGEATPNTWIQFKDLLPRDPLLIGTLSSTDGATSLLTLLDGGVVRVRGTGTVAAKYYLRGGKIDGPAPNLTQSEIIV